MTRMLKPASTGSWIQVLHIFYRPELYICVNHSLVAFTRLKHLIIFPFPFLFRLEKMGALEIDKVVHRHQAWRLISCIWLHAGVFHILANMLSLVFIGIRLEQEFGFGMHLVSLLCVTMHISNAF